MAEATTLDGRRDALYKRLETGYERIEREMRAGDQDEARRWEDVWLQLLAEYEDVCRRVQRAAE
jgi:hypothetical protein